MIDRSKYERVIADARAGAFEGLEMEDILHLLKREGFSPVDSIRAIVELGLCIQSEAKRTVHYSAAWSPIRKQSEQLHEEAEAALRDNNDED
jgi:hypothetical protein